MGFMSSGGTTIALVEYKLGGVRCEAFESRLQMVLASIDTGDLGGGFGYGSEEHKAALAELEKQIDETRAKIALEDEREALVAAEPKNPPCLQCGAMTAEEGGEKCCASEDDCHGCRLWPG